MPQPAYVKELQHFLQMINYLSNAYPYELRLDTAYMSESRKNDPSLWGPKTR